MQISAGLADPFAGEGSIRLHYVLRGLRKCQANNFAATRRPLSCPSLLYFASDQISMGRVLGSS